MNLALMLLRVGAAHWGGAAAAMVTARAMSSVKAASVGILPMAKTIIPRKRPFASITPRSAPKAQRQTAVFLFPTSRFASRTRMATFCIIPKRQKFFLGKTIRTIAALSPGIRIMRQAPSALVWELLTRMRLEQETKFAFL